MAHPILMPMPGQMTEECTVVAWHKREGDPVRKGDVLFEIETDKSNMDVEAFDDGVLLRILVHEGETVPVNAVCAYVGEPGETLPDAAGDGAAATLVAEMPATAALMTQAAGGTAAATATSPATAPVLRPAEPGPDNGAAAGARARGRAPISPRAARLAGRLRLDPTAIAGTGPNGRIVERDVRAAAAARDARPVEATATAAGPSTVARPTGVPGPAASPAAAPIDPDALELAAHGLVATLGITGSGTDGRVTRADVERALRERPQPMSRMRQVIAQRLTESWTTTPHFTVTVAVDMTAALAVRAEIKAAGRDYSVTDLISLAVVRSLVEHPAVNGRTDGKQIWLRERVDLGLAVALDAGLVVPVIRDAQRMRLPELHERSAAVVAAARAGTLPPGELSGSTFTISNMGMLGVEQFSAIINPGEAAILAVSSTVPTPVVVGGGVGIRQIMRMTLSADHRLVDGALGAAFLGAVRGRLEDAELLRVEAAG
jgi:pyruvate dehydrogenase E2 component (dihydrolipoamide acetyltransferase)